MQPIPRRIFYLTLLALGLAWIAASRAAPGSMAERPAPAPQKGFPAPDFTLETLAGDTLSLSGQRGAPVIINFWASWCPPCRAEMPAMQAIYNDYGEQIVLLAVNATRQDNLGDIRDFVADYSLTFPILLDADGSAYQQYGIISLPTTFFIDADGIIREVVVGGPMTEAGLRVRIESLLERKP